jgi:hypothetical protein
MGSPWDDLVGLSAALWQREADNFAAKWHDLFNFYFEDPDFAAIIDAITGLSVAFEYAAALSAVSDLDNVEIGRDAAFGTIENLRHLAWPVLPRWGVLAAQWADRVALVRALQAEEYTRILVDREHKAMELRVLQEELARLVEVADVWARLHTEIAIERNDRVLAVDALRAQLTALIDKTRADLTAYIGQVRAQLAAQIAQLSAYAHSLPGLVDQEATSGYNPTLRPRAGTLQRLIDTLAAHDPFVAGVIKDLATFLIDLAEIDNPVLRLAAQFVLRQVIDHLGLDTALRDLAGKLLGGILGTGPPKTLAGVTEAIGNRLNAVEGAVSDLAPLAGEADDLHEMGTLAFDTALLAYLAAGITDPRAWADDTNAVLNATAGQVLGPLLRLLGAP